ncbi:hypothetical protein NHX12_019592 [Muraenolepis orangiensis]|uniref:Uncharacterized protein n=1 Tax=Muraenolepis orangiensis TaxID=630683 RepID=A0A9Q0ETL6_9TELE|nr:hypothetical protein NHX12_019592 [Muraenolepis orangiensis]
MYTITTRRKERGISRVPEDLYYLWLQVGSHNDISPQFNCQQPRCWLGSPCSGARPLFIHLRNHFQQDSEAPTRSQTGRLGPNSKPSSPGRPGSGSFVPQSQTIWAPPGPRPASSHRRETTPTPELRDLSSTEMPSSSIPLTGDQQTDDHILAFIRARQNLIQRTDHKDPGGFACGQVVSSV